MIAPDNKTIQKACVSICEKYPGRIPLFINFINKNNDLIVITKLVLDPRIDYVNIFGLEMANIIRDEWDQKIMSLSDLLQ